jgi:hypothetical protein
MGKGTVIDDFAKETAWRAIPPERCWQISDGIGLHQVIAVKTDPASRRAAPVRTGQIERLSIANARRENNSRKNVVCPLIKKS